METQPIKLSKAVKIGIIIPAAFLAIFVLSGCSKKDAIQVDVTENEQNQDSQAMEEMKIQNEEQQKQLDILQKNQELADCQKIKEDCEKKIYELDNGAIKVSGGEILEGNRTEMINRLQGYIDSYTKQIKKLSDKELIKDLQKKVDKFESDIQIVKTTMANSQAEKNNLLAGECKDYQNPCE